MREKTYKSVRNRNFTKRSCLIRVRVGVTNMSFKWRNVDLKCGLQLHFNNSKIVLGVFLHCNYLGGDPKHILVWFCIFWREFLTSMQCKKISRHLRHMLWVSKTCPRPGEYSARRIMIIRRLSRKISCEMWQTRGFLAILSRFFKDLPPLAGESHMFMWWSGLLK